ncbi:uncharacterized protein CEXT_433791 [Caerostris extrusa]|uniref:DUF7041 domain-containing protein n=1 Tax=Caerostris extrusa TaxID=172846 RepID=A0AAV4TRE5_CAEEX|nr:uncharacterized protein CEXT_433791 [Caerostris extrusa]
MEELQKLHHVVSALQPEELAVVSDIILKPPADVPFTALKKRLCAQFADSEAQLLRYLIYCMQLGDRRPSRVLLEMRSKAGARINNDLLKSLFLQRLPTNVQQILAISNDNLDKLTEMADDIMLTSSAPVVNAVAASADQPDLRTIGIPEAVELKVFNYNAKLNDVIAFQETVQKFAVHLLLLEIMLVSCSSQSSAATIIA